MLVVTNRYIHAASGDTLTLSSLDETRCRQPGGVQTSRLVPQRIPKIAVTE